MSKPDKTPPISYADAVNQVRNYLQQRIAAAKLTSSGFVPLSEASGRILAEPIRADRDLPPFPRSTRDGFAARASEASTHQPLILSGLVRAGETPAGAIAPGHAWEIMTGAPVPRGADAVFMVEHAESSAGNVRLHEPRQIQPGENIVPQGAEARQGDLLVPPGARIAPAHIALAAQCGYGQLVVFPRPRVAILSTGDELVSVEATPGPSQIRNSNAPMLAALVAEAGGDPIVLPQAADEDPALDAALAEALTADLLLITGGISAGLFDLVAGALARAGAQFLFRQVAMQPGKPVVFGEIPRPGLAPLPFFALPGNPISSAVTFRLFAAPVLATLAGDTGTVPRFAQALLERNWRGKPGLTRFLPAVCNFSAQPQVALIPWQGSGDIAAFARSNCFVMIPDEVTELPEGSLVSILL